MKSLFTFVCLALIMATVHVSFAQDESPGRKQVIENQIQTPAVAEFAFLHVAEIAPFTILEPQCTENAFVEVDLYAGLPRACPASTDFGNCKAEILLSKNIKEYRLLAFTGSPLIHSSGGMPFSWRS